MTVKLREAGAFVDAHQAARVDGLWLPEAGGGEELPILDDFERANENPLDNDGATEWWAGGGFEIVDGQIKPTDVAQWGGAYATWGFPDGGEPDPPPGEWGWAVPQTLVITLGAPISAGEWGPPESPPAASYGVNMLIGFYGYDRGYETYFEPNWDVEPYDQAGFYAYARPGGPVDSYTTEGGYVPIPYGGIGARVGVSYDGETFRVLNGPPGGPVEVVWSIEDDSQAGMVGLPVLYAAGDEGSPAARIDDFRGGEF